MRQASLGEALTGHTRGIESVAFSPDGARLASGSEDGTIRLWDAARQVPLGEALTGHTREVTSVAFSPDGARLASAGSWDATIRLWDVARQASLGKPLTGHTHYVKSVAFSPDGTRLASGSRDETIRLWDVARQAPLGEALTGHTSWVTSVAFSADGARLVSGSDDNTVRLWALTPQGNATCVATLRWHSTIESVVFAPLHSQVSAFASSTQEDIFAIGDNYGVISLWGLSRREAQLRLISMPKHNAMPFVPYGTALSGCQMSAMSHRLLAQYGADVSGVTVVENSIDSAPTKLDSKPAAPAKPESKPVASVSPASPGSLGFFARFFASSIPKASPAAKQPPADAKAQGLLNELYSLVDELYPADDKQVTRKRLALLTKLKPYQDRYDTLTLADRGKLRRLQTELEEAQAALQSASLG